MTDKKYTNEEIVKALEDYIKENEFEYFHSNIMNEYPLIKKSLDIINRQKAEIEKLRAKVETRTQEKLALGRIYTHRNSKPLNMKHTMKHTKSLPKE